MERKRLEVDITKGYVYRYFSGLDGGITQPSSNILYTLDLFPRSFYGLGGADGFGGRYVFNLDDKYYLAIGMPNNDAYGNGYFIVDKSLLFCGGSVNPSLIGLKVYDIDTGDHVYFGSSITVARGEVVGVSSGNGSIVFNIGIDGNLSSVNVSISSGDTSAIVAKKIVDAVRSSLTSIMNNWYIYNRGSHVYLERKNFTDFETVVLSISPNSLGVDLINSVLLSTGQFSTGTFLSLRPKIARWIGSFFANPVLVGVSELDAPSLDVVPVNQRGVGFKGLVKGSRSVVVARKRWGTIGNGSSVSKVVECDVEGSSLYVYVPPVDSTTYGLMADGSLISDNSILLYFSYAGQGSLNLHKLFPIEIPEAELDGRLPPKLHVNGLATARVVSQHPTDINYRIVEVEFTDSDLLLFEPYTNRHGLDENVRFVARVGNCALYLGVGEKENGVDISFPNDFEQVNLEWRFWLDSIPIAIANSEDQMGSLWIGTEKAIWLVTWTGITETEAPVRFQMVTDKVSPLSRRCFVSLGDRVYFIDKSKQFVSVGSDGSIDFAVGSVVSGAFDSFSGDLVVGGFDKVRRLILVGFQSLWYAYQVDTNRWSSPLIFSFPGLGVLSIRDKTFISVDDSIFTLREFDKAHSGSIIWNLTTVPEVSYALKDVIEVWLKVSTSQPNENILIQAIKDFSNTAISLTNFDISSVNSYVSFRRFVEVLDCQAIQAQVIGQRGGTYIHDLLYLLHIHRIERSN